MKCLAIGSSSLEPNPFPNRQLTSEHPNGGGRHGVSNLNYSGSVAVWGGVVEQGLEQHTEHAGRALGDMGRGGQRTHHRLIHQPPYKLHGQRTDMMVKKEGWRGGLVQLPQIVGASRMPIGDGACCSHRASKPCGSVAGRREKILCALERGVPCVQRLVTGLEILLGDSSPCWGFNFRATLPFRGVWGALAGVVICELSGAARHPLHLGRWPQGHVKYATHGPRKSSHHQIGEESRAGVGVGHQGSRSRHH